MNYCLAITTGFILFLAGCATIPEEKCASVDWYELGVMDGRAGYPTDRIAQHREACARTGIIPNENQYLEGRKIGLGEYCRLDNAIPEGLSGRPYRDVCDYSFTRLYKAAHEVYSLKSRIRTNMDKASYKEAEFRKEKNADSRDQLRSEIREIDRDRESLRNDLYAAERELARLRRSILEKR
jgi:hypothetical protein